MKDSKVVQELYADGMSVTDIAKRTGWHIDDVMLSLKSQLCQRNRSLVAEYKAEQGFFNVDDEPDWLVSHTDVKGNKIHNVKRNTW
jgi:hypothetical protein